MIYTAAENLKLYIRCECNKHSHSFEEGIIYDKDGISISTTIGGLAQGVQMSSMLMSAYEDNPNYALLRHYANLIDSYSKCYYRIPENL